MTRRRPASLRSALGVALALAPLGGCGEEAPPAPASVERFDSAGVSVVRWSGDGHAAPFRAQTEATLLEPGEVRELRGEDVAVGPDGAVHVLDRGGRQVLVLGEGGRRDTLGPGPAGEAAALREPTLLAVAPDGRVAVFDRPRQGVALYGRQGERGILSLPQPLQGDALAWTELGLLGVVGAFASRDSLQFRLQAFRLNAAPTDLATLTAPVPELLAPADCRTSIPFPRPFEPRLVWAADGERAAVTSGAGDRITLIGPAGPRMVLEGAGAPRPATAELAAAELVDTVVLGDEDGCRVAAADAVAAVGHAALVPAVAALALAPDGTLWVRRPDADGGGVDMYDADGGYLGTLPAETPFPAAFFSPDSYLAVIEGALVRVRLVEAAPAGG